jgi:hypothetical protein
VTRTLVAATLLAALAAGGERSAAEIVAEFRGIRIPWGFGMTEEEYDALVRERSWRQCALALELQARFPDHEAVPELMRTRWALLLNVFEDPARVLAETKEAPERLQVEAAFARAHATLESPEATPQEKLRSVREAVRKSPRDQEWVAFLLVEFARAHVASPEKQRELCEKVVKECPKADRDARDHLKALERVGQVLDVPIADADFTIVHFFGTYDARLRKDIQELLVAKAGVVGVLLVDNDDERARAQALKVPWPVHVMPDAWSGPGFVLVDRERRIKAMASRPGPLLEALSRRGE